MNLIIKDIKLRVWASKAEALKFPNATKAVPVTGDDGSQGYVVEVTDTANHIHACFFDQAGMLKADEVAKIGLPV